MAKPSSIFGLPFVAPRDEPVARPHAEGGAESNEVIEIDLSGAVLLRQALRVLIFINLAGFSLALTGFWMQPADGGNGPRYVILLGCAGLITALLALLNFRPGRRWLPVALYGLVLLLSAAVAWASLHAPPTSRNDEDQAHGEEYALEIVAFTLPSAVTFAWLLIIEPKTIARSRARDAWTLALARRKGAPPYWLFVLRNSAWKLSNVLAGLAALIGIALLVALSLVGIFLIPSLVCIRIICRAVLAHLSRNLPWSAITRDRARRRTCLYLRSFWDDDVSFGLPPFTEFLQQQWESGLRLRIVGKAQQYLYALPVLWLFEPGKQSIEEIVVRAVWPSCAVVAIGQSSHEDSPMAAVRFPLEDNDWQSAARALVQDAKLVVLLAGYTEGVKWEHEHLRSEAVLHKTLLLFPPEDEESHRERWEALVGDAPDESYTALFPRYDTDLLDRTIACAWAGDGRTVCFTSRSKARVAYDLGLRLACAPAPELLALDQRQ